MNEWTYIGEGEKDLYQCSCGAKWIPGVLEEDHASTCPNWDTHWACGCNDSPIPDGQPCPECGYDPEDE